MSKILHFRAPSLPSDPNRVAWEEALESDLGIYAPGEPPPRGVCPIAWAEATSLLPDVPDSAKIISLASRRR